MLVDYKNIFGHYMIINFWKTKEVVPEGNQNRNPEILSQVGKMESQNYKQQLGQKVKGNLHVSVFL